MFTRIAVSAFSVMVLIGCDETPKDASKQEETSCKRLSEAECAANDECNWNVAKAKCKMIKSDDNSSQESAPETESSTPDTVPDTAPAETPQ
jgi:hypothetical protein